MNLSYSVKQFCNIVGISRATLYAQWQKGDGPKSINIGKRRLITHEAATEWLQQLEGENNNDN